MIAWLDFLNDHYAIVVMLTLIVSLYLGTVVNNISILLPAMLQQQWQQECETFLQGSSATTTTDTISNHSPNHLTTTLQCSQCHYAVPSWRYIPVLSYLLQRGKCGACGAALSMRLPLIEISTTLLIMALLFTFGISLDTKLYSILVLALTTLTLIDYDTQLLPDNITLPLVWLGLIANSFEFRVPLNEAVWGAVLGYLSLWLIYWGFKLLTGKEGMGYGDFKLLAALGAWLGWQALPLILMLSSVVGTVVALALIALKKHDRTQPLPFGPYLAAAGIIMIFRQDAFSLLYLS